MFDDGSVRSGSSDGHNAISFDRFSHFVNKYLAKCFNIYQLIA